MSTPASTLPYILRALYDAGYELVGECRRSRMSAPLHRVLDTLLQEYGSDRRLINGIPILLAKASEKELTGLREIRSGIVNPTGYLIETTAQVLQQMSAPEDQQAEYTQAAARLTAQLPYLRRRRGTTGYTLPTGLGPEKLRMLRQQRSAIARKWKVIDFNREPEFRDLLQQYL